MTSSRVPMIVVDDRKDNHTSSTSTSPNHHNRHATATTSSPSPCQQPQQANSNTYNPSPSTPSTQPRPSKSKDDGRGEEDSTSTTITTTTTTSTTTAPRINVVHPSRPQIATRSSSDIGIPAASMPNLSHYQIGGVPGSGGGGGAEGGNVTGCGENYLGVYCSPRTTRRSVDLDLKETVPGQYDWMDSLDTSANSLKVLTASSRVGSALSLNSECTTRSIGLLSNDSDSEEFSQSENKPAGQGQLRRYMSYPEEAHVPESNARPSQSLSNLKSANHSPSVSRGDRYLQRQSLDYADLGESSRTIAVQDEANGGESDRSNNQPSCSVVKESKDGKGESGGSVVVGDGKVGGKSSGSVVEGEEGVVLGESVGGGGGGGGGVSRRQLQDGSAGKSEPVAWKRGGVIGSVKKANNNNMLCYKGDSNSPSREGRIRQWLQDMDTTQTDDVIP